MLRKVAIDTEYDPQHIPFIATSYDDKGETVVYYLEDPQDVFRLRRITSNPSIIKIFHQASADIFVLRNIEIPVVPPYEDTMIQASLKNENFARLKLKLLAQLFLGEDVAEEKTLKQAVSKYKAKAKREGREFSWREIPKEIIIPYAKKDPYYTYKLNELWLADVKRNYGELYRFEKSLIPIVVWMQENGLPIDREYCYEILKKYQDQMTVLYERMCVYLSEHDVDPTGFKPNSSPQLSLIAEYLELPVTKKTDGGKTGIQRWKMDAEVLMELLPHPFIRTLLDYRFFKKHYGTYYKPFYYRYTSKQDDTAHFMFYQSGAKTGRFSAELLQTFPKPEESKKSGQMHEVRNVVKARPREILVSLDAEQIEMRLFAHFSKSERMIEGFLKGMDPYVAIAYELFGEEMMNISKAMAKALRQIGKRIALGIIYGMGTWKLIWSLVHELQEKVDAETWKQLDMSENRASEILYRFHLLYPVKQYMNQVTSEIWRTGVLRLDIDSPLMQVHREYRIPKDKSYKGANAIIQGTAAYVLKYMMIRSVRLIRSHNWTDVRMRACVHDELLFGMNADEQAGPKIRLLKKYMEDKDTFSVPITVAAKVSTHSWGKVRDWDCEQDVLQVAA